MARAEPAPRAGDVIVPGFALPADASRVALPRRDVPSALEPLGRVFAWAPVSSRSFLAPALGIAATCPRSPPLRLRGRSSTQGRILVDSERRMRMRAEVAQEPERVGRPAAGLIGEGRKAVDLPGLDLTLLACRRNPLTVCISFARRRVSHLLVGIDSLVSVESFPVVDSIHRW